MSTGYRIDDNGEGVSLIKLCTGTGTRLKSITPGANVTIVDDGDGNLTFSSSGGGGGGSGYARDIASISTATTLGATANTDYIRTVTGTTTVTLPTAVGNTNEYTIIRAGTNTVTIATTSAQTITGSSTATLTVQWQAITLISDGANWVIK